MGKPNVAFVEIEIVNWSRFNPRSDVKESSWFRLSHDLFQRPDMHDFSAAEIAAWVFVLCSCSYANTGLIRLSYAHASRVGRLKSSVVDSALVKLERNQMIKIIARNVGVTRAAPTDDTNETDVTYETRRDGVSGSDEPGLTPLKLFELWNLTRGSLPKAAHLTKARTATAKTQIRKYPDEKHWCEAIEKFKASDFCTTTWRPGFDDLLKETKRLRAIEGNYDNSAGKSQNSLPFATHATRNSANNAALMQKVLRGEL